MRNQGQAGYGNWVSNKLIARTFIVFVIFGAAAAAMFVFAPKWGTLTFVFQILFSVLAALFLVFGFYLMIARREFSPEGKDVQNKIIRMLLSYTDWDGQGQALDIGCGSGALTVLLAGKYPNARVTGTDFWGGSWGYSQKQCEENARQEGVLGRVRFVQGSAEALAFPDETFDLAVSNLVFHEVKNIRDKRSLIKEALRVVKKGGRFAFQDLLKLKAYFGTKDELIAYIEDLGVKEVHFEDTSKSSFIPRALKLSFMTGALGIIYGIK